MKIKLKRDHRFCTTLFKREPVRKINFKIDVTSGLKIFRMVVPLATQ